MRGFNVGIAYKQVFPFDILIAEKTWFMGHELCNNDLMS